MKQMDKYQTGRPSGGIPEGRILSISDPFYPYCRIGTICHPLHLRYITGHGNTLSGTQPVGVGNGLVTVGELALRVFHLLAPLLADRPCVSFIVQGREISDILVKSAEMIQLLLVWVVDLR